MTRGPLQNYLSTHRRKTGLSQEEIAHLVGAERETTISRHESAKRLPALEVALAYEVVYQVPLRELFAGHAVEVVARLRANAYSLLDDPEKLTGPRAEQKAQTLTRLAETDETLVLPLWGKS